MMNYFCLVLWCLVVGLASTLADDRIECLGDTYYDSSNGSAVCRDCPFCYGGGIGYDDTAQRLKGNHGYESCYPCDECLPGYYRSVKSPTPYCDKCVLDCARANRLWSKKCGGDNEGHCGDCLAGYKPESSEPNSMCFQDKDDKQAELDHTPDNRSPGVQDTQNPSPNYKDDATEAPKNEVNAKEDLLLLILPVMVPFFLLALVIGLVGYGYFFFRNRRRSHQDRRYTPRSDSYLVGASNSTTDSTAALEGPAGKMAEKPEFVLGKDVLELVSETDTLLPGGSTNMERPAEAIECTDTYPDSGPSLETDGPGTDASPDQPRNVQREGATDTKHQALSTQGSEAGHSVVRGELPSREIISEGNGLVQEKVGKGSPRAKPKPNPECVRRPFYNRPLDKGDNTITSASQGIYGERRYELFQTYLKLDDAKIHPLEELWLKNSERNSFQDYIRDCLKTWLQKFGDKADLKWLLESLVKSGFEEVAYEIVELKENEPPENYPECDANVMLITLPIRS